MALDLKDVRQRSAAAARLKQDIQPMLDDLYEYALPYRRPKQAGEGEGQQRLERVFDNTGIAASFRFAGRLQADMFPPEGTMFVLEPGPVAKLAGKQAERMSTALAQDSAVVHALFRGGEWDTAFHEMALDLGGGTGAMLILEGDANTIVRFVSTPIQEVHLEAGPYGDVWGQYWPKTRPAHQIRTLWPDADLPAKIRNVDDVSREFPVEQACLYDPDTGGWHLLAFLGDEQGNSGLLKHEITAACPWVTPRYHRMPGHVYGRGPLSIAMPTIKTLNRASEYALKGAALAILGVFTRTDDGVFNPAMAKVAPGAMWTVSRNGGVLGPAVQKLDIPGRYDLSTIVLNDLRAQVKEATMDRSLPPDAGGVRSATEIVERARSLANDHVGAVGRLQRELLVPAVRRVMEIARKKRLLQTKMRVDELVTAVSITSPIGIAQKTQRVQRTMEALQMAGAIGGAPAIQANFKLFEALQWAARELGMPPEFILGDAEKRERDTIRQQAAQEAVQGAVEAAKQAKSAANALTA